MPNAGRVAWCLPTLWPHTLGSVVVMRMVHIAESKSSCEVGTAVMRKGSHRRILFCRSGKQPVANWFRTVAGIGTVERGGRLLNARQMPARL